MEPENGFVVTPVLRGAIVSHSCRIVSESDPSEWLVLVVGNELEVRSAKDAVCIVFSISFHGRALMLQSINGGKQCILLTTSRGSEQFFVYGQFPRTVLLHTSAMLGECFGAVVERPVYSREVNGIICIQLREGVLHVLKDMSVNCVQFQEPSTCSLSCISVISRSGSCYGVLGIMESRLYLFELTVDGSEVSVEQVRQLPPTVAGIYEEVKPYAMITGRSSVMFIGGDSVTYSAISVISNEQLFQEGSDTRPPLESIHYMALPHLVGEEVSEGRFICTTSRGDLVEFFSHQSSTYLIDAPTLLSNRVASYVLGTPMGALTWLSSSEQLFIGSAVGSSVLYKIEGKSVRSDCPAVTSGLGPVLGIAKGCSSERMVVSVGGVGRNSASLAKTVVSGLGVTLLDLDKDLGGIEKFFCVLNGTVLLVETVSATRFFSFNRTTGELVETQVDMGERRKCIAAFEHAEMALVVFSDFVGVVTVEGVALLFKKTWSSPNGDRILHCAYDRGLLVMALQSGKTLLLGTKGSRDLLHGLPDEVSCVAVANNVVAIGCWSGTIKFFALTDNDTPIVLGECVGGWDQIPRSLAFLGNTAVCAWSDGSVSVIEIFFASPEHFASTKTFAYTHVSAEFSPQVSELTFSQSINSVIVSGSVPGFIGEDAIFVPFVKQTKSGEVAPVDPYMRSCHLGDSLLWWVDQKSTLRCGRTTNETCSMTVQKRFLDLGGNSAGGILVPDCVDSIVDSGTNRTVLAVGVNVEGTSNMANTTTNHILFYEYNQLTFLGSTALFRGSTLTCLSGWQSEQAFLVGLSSSSDVESSSRVVLVRAPPHHGLAHSASMRLEGPVFGLCVVNAFSKNSAPLFVVSSGRTIFVLSYDGTQNIFSILTSTETGYLVVGLDVWAVAREEAPYFSLLVRDAQLGVSLYSYEETCVLKSLGQDLSRCSPAGAALVGPDTCLFAETQGNVFLAALLEPKTNKRIERLAGANLKNGVRVTAFCKSAGGPVWIGTAEGDLVCMQNVCAKNSRKINFPIDPVYEKFRTSSPSVGQVLKRA